MNRRICLLAMLAALSMLAPAANATWYAFGNQEPSSERYDGPAVMWSKPYTGVGERVYFNAFETHQVASGLNPNVATTGMAVRPFPMAQFDAMFGVWKDCNGDGYVGLAESALLEYRAELLLDEDVCPREPGKALAHNDGQWVYEYLMFAVQNPCTFATDEQRKEDSGHACEGSDDEPTLHPGVIPLHSTPDAPVLVWGDNQRPDFLAAPGGTCAITPLPEGVTSSTGSMLRYADCSTGVLDRMNTVTQTVDPNDDLNLRWDDTDNPHKEDHALNFGLPVNLYGNPVAGQDGQTGAIEENGEQPAYTYDCQRTDVADPTGSSMRRMGYKDDTSALPKSVPNPDQDPNDPEDDDIQLETDDGYYLVAINGTDDDGVILGLGIGTPSDPTATGSFYDGANQTWDGVYVGGSMGQDGDCDPETRNDFPVDNQKGLADAPGSEGTAQTPARRQTDWTFSFSGIGGLLFDDGRNPFQSGATGSAIGARTPHDGGLPHMRWWTGYTWIGTPNLITGPDEPVRTDLTPPEPEYYTFYATLNLADLGRYFSSVDLPAFGASEIYGITQCPSIGTGAEPSGGFDCDPDNWWKGPNDSDISAPYDDGTPTRARVGQTYYLRDTDCFDNHVAADVRAGMFVPCE